MSSIVVFFYKPVRVINSNSDWPSVQIDLLDIAMPKVCHFSVISILLFPSKS
jgi:hypothetical protein